MGLAIRLQDLAFTAKTITMKQSWSNLKLPRLGMSYILGHLIGSWLAKVSCDWLRGCSEAGYVQYDFLHSSKVSWKATQEQHLPSLRFDGWSRIEFANGKIWHSNGACAKHITTQYILAALVVFCFHLLPPKTILNRICHSELGFGC